MAGDEDQGLVMARIHPLYRQYAAFDCEVTQFFGIGVSSYFRT